MRLLIADDHDLVRDTIAAYLAAASGQEVRTASTLPEALIEMGQRPFDLVLLDYAMPGMNGLEGLKRALALSQGRPVGMISGTSSRSLAEAAVAAGAAGFVPKTLAAQAMVAAVRVMAAGDVFTPIALLQADAPLPAGNEHGLTRRELDVLRGLSAGKSNKEIARDLDLQEVTVKLHVKTLSRKLTAKNRTHAAMIARDQGLI